MSHSQFHSIIYLYLDMHGLIFETSVWLLAESTRLLPSIPARAEHVGTLLLPMAYPRAWQEHASAKSFMYLGTTKRHAV